MCKKVIELQDWEEIYEEFKDILENSEQVEKAKIWQEMGNRDKNGTIQQAIYWREVSIQKDMLDMIDENIREKFKEKRGI